MEQGHALSRGVDTVLRPGDMVRANTYMYPTRAADTVSGMFRRGMVITVVEQPNEARPNTLVLSCDSVMVGWVWSDECKSL